MGGFGADHRACRRIPRDAASLPPAAIGSRGHRIPRAWIPRAWIPRVCTRLRPPSWCACSRVRALLDPLAPGMASHQSYRAAQLGSAPGEAVPQVLAAMQSVRSPLALPSAGATSGSTQKLTKPLTKPLMKPLMKPLTQRALSAASVDVPAS